MRVGQMENLQKKTKKSPDADTSRMFEYSLVSCVAWSKLSWTRPVGQSVVVQPNQA